MSDAEAKRVALYADGSCHGNPGPGGWAAILECNGHTRELTGAERATTNNQMELRAVIEGLTRAQGALPRRGLERLALRRSTA